LGNFPICINKLFYRLLLQSDDAVMTEHVMLVPANVISDGEFHDPCCSCFNNWKFCWSVPIL